MSARCHIRARERVSRVSLDPTSLPPDALAFLAERHLATLTTLRGDGSPHVVAVGFTWSDGVARVITDSGSRKAAHARRGGRAVVAQVDGARWLSLEGRVVVSDDPARVARAVELYAGRYRQPRVNPTRVVLEIEVDRVLGRP
jgi:PPOX class probable F420-dependent enzyme